MRARRMIGAAAAALVMAGTLLAPVAEVAEAAPAAATTTRAATTTTASQYRLVRSAKMRQAATRSDQATLAAVTKAVHGSEFTAGVPTSDYTVRGLRVHGAWARVTLSPAKGAELDPATVLLQKSRGTWSVVDLGTAEVGCGIAPAASLTALGLNCS